MNLACKVRFSARSKWGNKWRRWSKSCDISQMSNNQFALYSENRNQDSQQRAPRPDPLCAGGRSDARRETGCRRGWESALQDLGQMEWKSVRIRRRGTKTHDAFHNKWSLINNIKRTCNALNCCSLRRTLNRSCENCSLRSYYTSIVRTLRRALCTMIFWLPWWIVRGNWN